MPSCTVKNPGIEAVALSYPLRGLLGGKQEIAVGFSAAQLLAAWGSPTPLLVRDLAATYAGPLDTAYVDGAPKTVAGTTYTPTMADVGVDLLLTNAAGCTVTLDATLPDGAAFVFWDGTHAAAATPHTFQPSTGQLYAEQGALQNSYSFNRSNGVQLVKKIGGVWYVGQ